MNSLYYKGLLFLFFSIALSSTILWINDYVAGDEIDNKLFIVCTTTLIADAVRSIAGDKVHIECLMGPGVDPHTYRAREGDVHRMAKADIIFYNGLHLEGRMQEILSSLSYAVKTVAVTDTLDRSALRYLSEKVYDPHVWHNVSLWRDCVRFIAESIIENDPENTEYYKKNTYTYDEQLEHLDKYCMQRIAQLPEHRRIVVTAHDAFYYCAQRYNFSVIGVQGMSTEAEVTMHDIQDTITLIVKHNIPAIFVESTVSPRAIRAIQEGVARYGHSVAIGPELYSDTLGDEFSDGATYEHMIRHNVDIIVASLFS